MKTYKTIFFVMVILATTFISCKKGDTGPQGTAGIDGNADVFGTNDITLNSSDWVANETYFYADITSPEITQAIIDHGVVIVYEKSELFWNALPYTWGIISVSFDFGLKTVGIYYNNNDGSQTINPGTKTFRIVSISASNAKAYSNIDWKNYDSVKKTFNLPD